MKNKTTLIFVVLIVLVVGLLIWAKSQSEPREIVGRNWQDTNVSCLIFGHQNLASHIHPILTITVDGTPEPIPGNIGVVPECMSEVHTHDGTGQLHIESVVQGKTFTLADFFAVWGEPIDREGYSYVLTANGQEIDPATYTLQDADQIMLQYFSGDEAPATSDTIPTSDVNFELTL